MKFDPRSMLKKIQAGFQVAFSTALISILRGSNLNYVLSAVYLYEVIKSICYYCLSIGDPWEIELNW